MSAIFLSDVHLKDANSVKTQLMVRFLREVAARFESIYILGDFFDVWPGTNTYLVESFQPVLQVLAQLVRDGHKVSYLEGNHDFRLGRYFSEELGIRVYSEEIIEHWNGRRIYMAHGDLGNPSERGYRVLRYVLRHGAFQKILSFVPPHLLYRAGDKVSRFSRNFQKKIPPDEGKVRQTYRETAMRCFAKGYDVVIMGHTHLPDYFVWDGPDRRCHYYNLGDWVKNFTYLEFDGSEFYTRTHPVKDL